MRRLQLALSFILLASVAYGHDDGRYADSPLKPWFDNLRSGKGLCCSFADGVTLKDPDWDQKNNHYRVRIPAHSVTADGKKTFPEEDTWVEVPDDAVIKEPNKFGPAVVWPFWNYYHDKVEIRCFIPGSLT